MKVAKILFILTLYNKEICFVVITVMKVWLNNILNIDILSLTVSRVAFSASLLVDGSRTFGPFNTFSTLVFRNVVTNIGNAYNQQTGNNLHQYKSEQISDLIYH